MKSKKLPCAEFLHECFEYNFMTGVLLWRVRPVSHFKRIADWKMWNTKFAGTPAGTIDKDGYVCITASGMWMKAHRVIMAMATVFDESKEVDHRSGDTSNNKITNLREASSSENGMNRGKQSNSLSLYKGVHFHRRRGKYQAHIKKNGKKLHLGTFATENEARDAYREAVVDLHGVFANAGGAK